MAHCRPCHVHEVFQATRQSCDTDQQADEQVLVYSLMRQRSACLADITASCQALQMSSLITELLGCCLAVLGSAKCMLPRWFGHRQSWLNAPHAMLDCLCITSCNRKLVLPAACQLLLEAGLAHWQQYKVLFVCGLTASQCLAQIRWDSAFNYSSIPSIE